MNILCLGCSWTSGLHIGDHKGFANSGEINWVRQIAKIMPEHNFYNFAFPGTSVMHSINVLHQSKKLLNFDKVIFQITNEGRYTYYKNLPHNFVSLDRVVQENKNYFYLDLTMDQVWNINFGVLNQKVFMREEDKDRFSLAKMWYERFTSTSNFCIEHKVSIEYLKSQVDLLFFHKKDCCFIDNVQTIQDQILNEKWNDYVIDDGCHFNLDGCIWQANFIKEKLFSVN
jgi:hypothetical protein